MLPYIPGKKGKRYRYTKIRTSKKTMGIDIKLCYQCGNVIPDKDRKKYGGLCVQCAIGHEREFHKNCDIKSEGEDVK